MSTIVPPGRSIVRWKILVLLTMASIVAYVLRTNMSVAGEQMVRDLCGVPVGQEAHREDAAVIGLIAILIGTALPRQDCLQPS